jgi:hypothetical protein
MTTGESHHADAAALANGRRDLAFAAHCGPRSRRWLRRSVVAGASLLLMVALACAGLVLLLTRGPVEVAFLSERIATGIEQQFGGGVDVDVGRTVLEKSETGLELHVFDVVLKDGSGREILRSPSAKVSFDPLRMLFRGLAPEKLALRGMAMRAEITPEGDFLFKTSAEDQAAEAESTARAADVLAFAIGFGGPGSAAGLSAISIVDASLTIQDRRNGKRLDFENLTLAFGSPRPGMVEARGSLRKGSDVVPFSMTSEAVEGGRRLDFGFAGVGDQVIQALLGAKTPVIHVGAKLSASAKVFVGEDAKLRSLSFEAAMGRGDVSIMGPMPVDYKVERFRLVAEWDAGRPREATFGADVAIDGATLAFSGPLAVPASGWDPWRWTGTGRGWRLSGTEPGDEPFGVDDASIDVTLDPNARSIQIHRLTLKGRAVDLSLSADAAVEEEGLGFSLWLEAGRMPVRHALRFWPSFAAPPARDFLATKVRDGEIGRVLMTLAMPPPVLRRALALQALPREAVKIDFAVENGVLALGPGLPVVGGIAGEGRLDAIEMSGVFPRAFVEPKAGRRVSLSDGTLAISGLDTPIPDLRLRFKVGGALDAVADVLRAPDLKSAHGVELDPAALRGQFDGNVSIALPLKDNLKPAEIVTEVSARATGVTVEKAIGKDKLEGANLAMTASRTGVELKGEGRWQGTPVALSLERDASEGRHTAVMSLSLDEAALKRRGINLQGQVQGSLPVRIRSSGDPRDSKVQVEVDLSRAAVDGLLPGLQKPAGRPGKLTFDATEKKDGGYAIQNIMLDLGPSSFRGQADLGADGAITAARFSLFRLSPGDNVKLDYERPNGGVGKVTIRGNNFDARPFLRIAGDPGKRDGDRDLDVDLKTTLLSGHGGEVLTSAEARLSLRSSALRQVSVTGKLNGRPVAVQGRAAGDGPLPVAVESDDAGALFRYVDLYSRMQGGDLTGEVVVSQRRMSGFVLANDFALRDEPAFRRLLAEGRTDAGVAIARDPRFTKMRIDFAREGSETAVKDAVIFGQELGLTFNGVIDQIRDRISLSGTFVPAYGLNNAFAQIPLVGNILGGGRNEGLLAVTFGVSGRVSQPTVTVNPLSAVAPGIFRKIFEFRNDRSAQPPPALAAPAPTGSTGN